MSQPGFWEFPGGKVEQDELPEECLRREIYEELNISISILIAMSPRKFSYSHEKKIRLLPYLCTWLSGSIRLSEHESFQWLSREELYSINWAPADLPIVQELDRFWNPVRKLILSNTESQNNDS